MCATSGPHSSTNSCSLAAVVFEPDDVKTRRVLLGCRENPGRSVCRAVIYDDDLDHVKAGLRRSLFDLVLEHTKQAWKPARLVECRHDDGERLHRLIIAEASSDLQVGRTLVLGAGEKRPSVGRRSGSWR